MDTDKSASGNYKTISIEIGIDTKLIGSRPAFREKNHLSSLSRRSAETQIFKRVSQAGGIVNIDLGRTRDELIYAAYFYLGVLTFSFEGNPGYRYAQARYTAREVLKYKNVYTLSEELRHKGISVKNKLSIDKLEYGSIDLASKIVMSITVPASIISATADFPNAYDVIRDAMRPTIAEIYKFTDDYIERLHCVVRDCGVNCWQSHSLHEPDGTDLGQHGEWNLRGGL